MATRSRRLTVSREHEGRAEPRQRPGDVVAAVLEGSHNEQEAMSQGSGGRELTQTQEHIDYPKFKTTQSQSMAGEICMCG